jgi:hypothetical protein
MKFLESYPPITSSTDVFFLVLFWGGVLLLYLLRKLPIFNVLWYVVKWFFITLLVVLGVNFAKGEVKKWWDK